MELYFEMWEFCGDERRGLRGTRGPCHVHLKVDVTAWLSLWDGRPVALESGGCWDSEAFLYNL